MRFVLGGVRRDLSYEDVIAAATRVVMDGIDGRNKYYVAIGGRRLPVKRLFAQATGLDPSEFIPSDANRILKKLGFEIRQFEIPPASLASASNLDKGENSKTGPLSFAVSLEQDEDGFILASCPQLPGCHSQGRSREEAIRNIEEAIRGYTASMKRHGEEVPVLDWELIEVAL